MALEGSGKVVEVKEGDVYALDGHESHHLRYQSRAIIFQPNNKISFLLFC